MKRRALPLGTQDFIGIREDGWVYVDKTARIYDLISGNGKVFFLSRPRRFGKSLLCSTLAAIFEGRRNLFGEIAGQSALAIDSLDWEWKKHPVIRMVTSDAFQRYTADNMSARAILYQSGYLTISDYDEESDVYKTGLSKRRGTRFFCGVFVEAF